MLCYRCPIGTVANFADMLLRTGVGLAYDWHRNNAGGNVPATK